MMIAPTKPVPAGTSVMEEFRVNGQAQFVVSLKPPHLPSEDWRSGELLSCPTIERAIPLTSIII